LIHARPDGSDPPPGIDVPWTPVEDRLAEAKPRGDVAIFKSIEVGVHKLESARIIDLRKEG